MYSSVYLSIILFFLHIGIDLGYSIPRMQGLLSEPSAQALPISVTLLYSMSRNGYKRILMICVSLLAIYLTKSPTVFIVSFISLFFYFISFKQRLIQIIIFLFLLLLIYHSLDILEWIDLFIDNSTLTRVIDGFISIKTLGQVGYNPRVIGIMQFFKDVTETPFIFYLGRGLDSATSYYLNKGTLRYTYNLPSEIMFSLGIVGVFFYITFILIILKTMLKSYISRILFISILVYTTLNSAMGISYQIFMYIYFSYMFQILLRNIYNERNNEDLCINNNPIL